MFFIFLFCFLSALFHNNCINALQMKNKPKPTITLKNQLSKKLYGTLYKVTIEPIGTSIELKAKPENDSQSTFIMELPSSALENGQLFLHVTDSEFDLNKESDLQRLFMSLENNTPSYSNISLTGKWPAYFTFTGFKPQTPFAPMIAMP